MAVLSTHAFLDSGMLVTGGMKTQWNNLVPVKLNILMWHINLDSILTKKRLSAVSIKLHLVGRKGMKFEGKRFQFPQIHVFGST